MWKGWKCEPDENYEHDDNDKHVENDEHEYDYGK